MLALFLGASPTAHAQRPPKQATSVQPTDAIMQRRIDQQRDSLRRDSVRRAGLASPEVPLTATQIRRMPSVVDSTVPAARRTLSRLKLIARIDPQDTRDPVGDGLVVAQTPAAGDTLPRTSRIVSLIVRRYVPAEMVEVPDVTGQLLGEAVRRVQEVPLTARFGTMSRRSNQYATVVGQTPSPGTRVPAGDTVVLTVEVLSMVPRVVGNDLAVATQTLIDRGLRIRVVGEEYS
jgi:beta-lactam-binding protein with PASTA domain